MTGNETGLLNQVRRVNRLGAESQMGDRDSAGARAVLEGPRALRVVLVEVTKAHIDPGVSRDRRSRDKGRGGVASAG